MLTQTEDLSSSRGGLEVLLLAVNGDADRLQQLQIFDLVVDEAVTNDTV